MNYARIKKYDIANGPGMRASLYVSGCTHGCKGCFNEVAWDFNYGKKWTKEVEDELIEHLKQPEIKGLNVLGGEPLQQGYDLSIALKRIKEEVDKPIWLWTGYKLEDAIGFKHMMETLKYVDVLIDGQFEEDKKDITLKYGASSNQRVIDLKSLFNSGMTVCTDEKGKVTIKPELKLLEGC